MKGLKSVVSFVLVALTVSVLGHAQTGSIQGTVTDATGAVVQGADVVVRNLDTNQERTAKSSVSGTFAVTNLPAGKYEVTVNKVGFRVYKVGGAVLTVDQVLTANARLEPGATSEEVQVQGDVIPPVDLDTAQVSNMVESRQMLDLPLITRDPYSLVLLSPGTSQTNTSLGGFTVNGSRERNNNFLLDGVDNNDTSVPGIPDGILGANPDSTEEFRVITNNFNAEFGRNTGAIIDVITKPGTNQFHGGAYEFGRWNSLGGARDWFNPRVAADGSLNPMNPYTRNQFGYSIGGPIRKNKTFFFFNQEFQRFRTTLTNSVIAPTAAFKTGVFTYTNPVTGVSAPVDLTQSNGCATNNNGFCAPADPTMQKIFALYPTPAASADGISGVAFFPSASKQDSYNTVAKIDHQINQKNSLSLRYGYDHFFDPNPYHNDILPNNVGGISNKSIEQGLAANLTSTLKPSMVNQLVFGWNKLYSNFGCTGLNVVDSVSPLDAYGNGIDYVMGPFTNFGCLGLASDGQWRKTGTTSYADTFTWVRGTHTLKFGGDFHNVGEQGPNSFFSRRELTLTTYASQTGFTMINQPANDTCFANANCTLDEAASAYYGLTGNDFAGEFFNKAGARQATDNKLFRQHEYDWFAQDQWKVRRNLTLTLGLRYQLDGVPYEEGANFSNLLSNPSSFQDGQNVVMSIVGPGTGKSIYQPDHSNVEPRIGLSWDPWGDGKTSVRVGFGIFHDRVFGNLFGNARGNPPFEQDYNTFPFETVNNFFGTGLVPTVVPNTTPSATIPDNSLIAPVIFDTHYRNAASNNWNLGIQRELPGNNTIDLAYVASEAHHVYRQLDGNPPDPNLVNQLVAYCSNPSNALGCDPTQVSGILLYEGGQKPNDFGILPFDAVANNALVQPFYQQSVGNGVYNSLQLKVTHRMSHGLQLQGAYTWAHAIDDSSDPLMAAQGNRTFPRNSRNLAQDRGNSDNDIRHAAVINYIWEMPFGHGKSFLNHGALGKVLEGMQLGGITTLQTGHPFEIRCARDSQRTGISSWCDQAGDPFAAGSNDNFSNNLGNKVYFSNPAAFTTPPFGRAGSIGRNQFYGPGYVSFDMDFAKKMKLTERFGLEFRAECYNVFNTPHFQQPDNLQTDSTFGLISATVARPDGTTSARQMQVALKLSF
jgi:hypothetical protein